MDHDVRTLMLSQAEEEELARAVEAGVLAESCDELTQGAGADDLRQIIQRGHRARERLLLANHGLVVSIAVAESRASSAGVDELIQEGYVGLGEALARYDYRRGRFGVFAAAWVRHVVRRAARTNCGRSHLSRRQLALLSRVRRTEAELCQRLGRSIATSELEGELMLDGPTTGWYRDYCEPVALERTDLSDEAAQDAFAAVVSITWSAEELVAGLSGLERRVVRERCGIGCPRRSYAQVAEGLGMSSTSIRRIEKRALARLRQRLEQAGIAA